MCSVADPHFMPHFKYAGPQARHPTRARELHLTPSLTRRMVSLGLLLVATVLTLYVAPRLSTTHSCTNNCTDIVSAMDSMAPAGHSMCSESQNLRQVSDPVHSNTTNMW